MALCTTTNIHRVVSVSVERIRFSDFSSLRFRFLAADGSTFEVDAFSAEPLSLQDVPEVAIEHSGAA